MIILGIHPGYHDACACVFDEYRLVAAVAQERLTRRKADGGRIPVEAIEDCLTIAGRSRDEVDAVVLGRGAFPSRYYTHLSGRRLVDSKIRRLLGKEKLKSMERECVRYHRTDSAAMFDAQSFLRDLGLRAETRSSFFNHHLAHALPTLFHTDWSDALLYTADGGGDNVQYSIRIFRHAQLETLYGGDEGLLRPMRIDSVGLAYGYATQALGFRINRHEGKLTGLAAYGRPSLFEAMAAHFRIDGDGQIHSDFESNRALRQFIFELAQSVAREDVACSVQKLLETFVVEAVRRVLARHPVRNLGLSGGVFANVLLNQKLAETLPVDEVFIYPAMSDAGLACGGVLQFLLERDGLASWLAKRYRLDTLYYGRDFGRAIDDRLGSDPAFRRISTTPIETSAELLEQGRIVAVYTHGGEYGPRALGARSILAAPVDAKINHSLNERLARSEFMPFAPAVLAEDAETVFDLGPVSRYAAQFMTITCSVRDAWRDRLPAVVHVDGTARPQVVARSQNSLYYDIIAAYKARSGIPVVVNTSFNVHEEPIVNSPDECARALADNRVDFVCTERGVYARADAD
ncbi:MAG: carbamoyltransferase C-terminal domain-containing protein [Alphaproteobacteria bacterium]